MEKSIIINEQQLLNWLMKNPKDILKIEDLNYFLSPISKAIAESIFNLYEKKIDINIDNLIVEANPKNESVDIEILKGISEKETVDFHHHYKKLKHNHIKQKYNYEILKDITEKFSVRTEIDIPKVETLIGTLQNYVFELKEDRSNRKVISLREAYQDYEIALKNRMQPGNEFSYGCSYLNDHIYRGPQPGEMTAVYSSSGMGKSTYDLYLFHKQRNLQIPSIYFTPENSRELTLDRLTCMKYRIPFTLLYPKLNEFQEIPDFIFEIVEKEKKSYRKGDKAFICDDPIISIKDLEKYIVEYKRLYGFDYMCCHLDLASMFQEFNDSYSKNKASSYEDSLNELHFTAKKTNCHFILVFQSKRPSEKLSIKSVEDLDKLKPQIEMIKNSSAIEERCRVILSLFRRKHYAEKYLPDNPETLVMEDIMEVQIQKQNTGPLSLLHYLYNPETYYVGKYIKPIETKVTLD